MGAGGGVWGVEDWVLGGRGWGGRGSDALGGWSPGEDGTDVRSDGRTDGRKFPPVFYRTSSPSGPLPKKDTKKPALYNQGEEG